MTKKAQTHYSKLDSAFKVSSRSQNVLYIELLVENISTIIKNCTTISKLQLIQEVLSTENSQNRL
jgi:hypothetical protein